MAKSRFLPRPIVSPVTLDGMAPGGSALVRGLPRSIVGFAVVGVVNTAIDVALFWVLHAPLGIVAANLLSTSAGMCFSFLANGRHTFRAERRTVRQAVLFVTTNVVTMWVLQPLVIAAAYGLAATPLMLAKVIALGGSVVTNFLLYRYVVWRPSSSPRGSSPRGTMPGVPTPSPQPAGLGAAPAEARR